MDWGAEPFSLGGYASLPALGSSVRDDTPFRPVGRVHFAGTESADLHMEGAAQAGERAAAEVIRGRYPIMPSARISSASLASSSA